ncbi:BON domain-containing protein [Halochromatium sp.]
MKRLREERRRGSRGRLLGTASLILGIVLGGIDLDPALAAETKELPGTETTASSPDSPTGPSKSPGMRSGHQAGMAAVDEDRRLAERIERRLAWDAELAPYDLEVSVNDGILNLSGSVSTTAESHRARRMANETEGIGGVVNALYVDPALVPFKNRSVGPPDDETVAKRLEVRLAHDPDLADETIEVEVEDGIVRLHGTLRDYSSEMRAKRLAESLYGVERVNSELEVATP